MSQAVKAILDASATLTADLANGANSIMHLQEVQGETPPYLVIKSEIIDPTDTNSGQSLDVVEVSVFIVSQFLYDETGSVGAHTIAGKVRTALHGASGTHGEESVNDIRFNDEGVPQLFNTTTNPRVQIEQTYTVWINR